MCEIDWALILEFFKVIVTWPMASVVIVGIFFYNFKLPLSEWIKNITDVEGDILGQKVKISGQQLTEKPKNVRDIIEETAKASDEIIDSSKSANMDIPEEIRDIPDVEKIIEHTRQNPASVVADLNRLLNKYLFERVFNAIFGSQIRLLEYLQSTPMQWHDVSHISGFYSSHKESAKDGLQDIFSFLKYLQLNGLIELKWGEEEKTIRGTKLTKEFLKYLYEMYPATWNQKLH